MDGDETHHTTTQSDPQSIFTNTIAVLRQQRDANADMIVQLTVQNQAITQLNAALTEELKTLQQDYDMLKAKYQEECQTHSDTRRQHEQTVAFLKEEMSHFRPNGAKTDYICDSILYELLTKNLHNKPEP